MELTELLRLLIEKLAPLVERGHDGCQTHDPEGCIKRIYEDAGRVLDKGLLIGRGV